MSRILGIDPGTHRIGFGILEKNEHQIKAIDFGCIDLKEKDKAKRLKMIFDKISALISAYKPNLLVIENLFFFKNHKTALSVAEARGVIILVCQIAGLRIIEPTPLQVKQGICGYGRAQKSQMQKMIQRILKLKEIPKPDDAADALAAAFWGLSVKKFNLGN